MVEPSFAPAAYRGNKEIFNKIDEGIERIMVGLQKVMVGLEKMASSEELKIVEAEKSQSTLGYQEEMKSSALPSTTAETSVKKTSYACKVLDKMPKRKLNVKSSYSGATGRNNDTENFEYLFLDELIIVSESEVETLEDIYPEGIFLNSHWYLSKAMCNIIPKEENFEAIALFFKYIRILPVMCPIEIPGNRFMCGKPEYDQIMLCKRKKATIGGISDVCARVARKEVLSWQAHPGSILCKVRSMAAELHSNLYGENSFIGMEEKLEKVELDEREAIEVDSLEGKIYLELVAYDKEMEPDDQHDMEIKKVFVSLFIEVNNSASPEGKFSGVCIKAKNQDNIDIEGSLIAYHGFDIKTVKPMVNIDSGGHYNMFDYRIDMTVTSESITILAATYVSNYTIMAAKYEVIVHDTEKSRCAHFVHQGLSSDLSKFPFDPEKMVHCCHTLEDKGVFGGGVLIHKNPSQLKKPAK